MPKEGASSGQLLGGEGNTLRQNQGWVPQTWAQGLGSSVLSAPGGGWVWPMPLSYTKTCRVPPSWQGFPRERHLPLAASPTHPTPTQKKISPSPGVVVWPRITLDTSSTHQLLQQP